MPGSSPTMARREPTIRLNSVDLPTLGRPTIAIVGTGALAGVTVLVLEMGSVKGFTRGQLPRLFQGRRPGIWRMQQPRNRYYRVSRVVDFPERPLLRRKRSVPLPVLRSGRSPF